MFILPKGFAARKSSRWKRSSNLEEENHRGGNAPQIWRKKIIVVEMFLRFGGRKSLWWKCSSNLEEENHCGGNVPPIWRRKIIVVEGEIPSLARQKSLTKLKTRGWEFLIKIFDYPQAIIWRKPIQTTQRVSNI